MTDDQSRQAATSPDRSRTAASRHEQPRPGTNARERWRTQNDLSSQPRKHPIEETPHRFAAPGQPPTEPPPAAQRTDPEKPPHPIAVTHPPSRISEHARCAPASYVRDRGPFQIRDTAFIFFLHRMSPRSNPPGTSRFETLHTCRARSTFASLSQFAPAPPRASSSKSSATMPPTPGLLP